MITNRDNFTVLTPPERLDTANSPNVEQEIVSAIDSGATKVLIDLSDTAFVASAGLRVILKVAKLLRQQNGSLALFGLNDQIAEVFEVSGFISLVNVCPTFEEAAKALATEE